ncbi:hypothetical protein Q0T12_14080, partial [Escherichia coli O87:H39]
SKTPSYTKSVSWQHHQDKEYPITIYHIAPFNKDLWSLLKSSQECPPGESKITNKCLHNSCIIKICPYGLK